MELVEVEVKIEVKMEPSEEKMTRMSLDHRIQIVRLSSIHQKYCRFRDVWKQKFGFEPPSRKTVAAINKKFNETGSVLDMKKTGRPKSSRAPENVRLVEEAIRKDPTKSLRALSQDLDINRATIHRIKQESESKNDFLQSENRLLKEKSRELNRRIDLLEAKNSNISRLRPETILLSGDSTFSRENIKPIAILEEQSVIANNKVLTVAASEGNPAMITFSNDGQVLHFPNDCTTYRIVEVNTVASSSLPTQIEQQLKPTHFCSKKKST